MPLLDDGPFHLHGRLLPGDDAVDLWVRDGVLTFTEQAGARTLVRDAWLLPGLVDAHAHLSMFSPSEEGTAQQRATASALQQLDAGVLLIREPGSPDDGAVGLGPAHGTPRVLTAGRFIVTEGGYVPGLGLETKPEDLVATVTAQATGNPWVKLVVDFFGDGGIVPTWTQADIARAVQAAHAAGAKVTVHATRPDAIVAAVDSGVDGIEHGTGMPPDLIPVLAERGVMWTPTLLIAEGIRGMASQSASANGIAEIESWLQQLPSSVAEAARQGVTILAGTDAGMGPHGQVLQELRLLHEAGLTVDQVLAAGSWGARRSLGFAGLEEGAPADLLAFDTDPRSDLNALGRPVVTVLDGRVLSR
jgi:imidazolonepropionase-like amidohydrolase